MSVSIESASRECEQSGRRGRKKKKRKMLDIWKHIHNRGGKPIFEWISNTNIVARGKQRHFLVLSHSLPSMPYDSSYQSEVEESSERCQANLSFAFGSTHFFIVSCFHSLSENIQDEPECLICLIFLFRFVNERRVRTVCFQQSSLSFFIPILTIFHPNSFLRSYYFPIHECCQLSNSRAYSPTSFSPDYLKHWSRSSSPMFRLQFYTGSLFIILTSFWWFPSGFLNNFCSLFVALTHFPFIIYAMPACSYQLDSNLTLHF